MTALARHVAIVREMLDTGDPVEASDEDATALQLAGLAARVEGSHHGLIEATDRAWGMTDEEIEVRLRAAGAGKS